jgi:hypothetical protein
VTLDASDVSMIAEQTSSQVTAAVGSTMSDIYSLLTVVGSNVSDVQSYLVGLSAELSDTYSAAAAGGTGDSAVISDIYSLLTVMRSDVSDVKSQADKIYSRVGLTGSVVSDVQSYLVNLSGTISDIQSQLTIIQSVVSDAHSAATAASSRALINQSNVSDIYSLLTTVGSSVSDVHSLVQARYETLSGAISDVDSMLAAGVTITTATARAVADEFLDRDIAGGASGGARNVRNALRPLRNRVVTDAATSLLKVYQENDTTVAWSATLSTAAGNPIVEVNPT